MSVLETRNVSLTIDNKRILEEVNLIVEKGELHALIGINGCGKSSIASILMGILKPSSGVILFNGKEVNSYDISKRAEEGMTLAWQEPVRFEGISIKDYLLLSSKDNSLDKVREALNKVGLLPARYLERDVDSSLSGGERKRIELASIYLMEPKLAILDEIDSGVDFVGIEQVMDTIKEIARKGSVLLITHQDEFLKIADRATLVCNGKSLRTGPPNEISKYYRYECTYCEDENNPDPNSEVAISVNR